MRKFISFLIFSMAVICQAITLNHSKWCMHSGQTLHLQAFNQNQYVDAGTWQSSNPEVATVNSDGVVTSVGEGKAVITVTVGATSATTEVTVTDEAAFDINITDVTNTHCSYSVVPADPSVHYYYQMRLSHGDEYSIDSMDDHGSIEENLFYFTYDWFDFCASLYGNMTWNDVMQPLLDHGTVTGDNTDFYSILTPGTDYTIYAMGFDTDGNLVTPVEMETFTTTAPSASDITFRFSIGQCTSSDAEFTVIPSNNDPYLVCVQRSSYVDWYVERDRINDMAQPLAESYANDARYPAIQSGSATLHASDFVNVRSNTDYYIIVFGYDDGVTSPVTIKYFRTEYGWTDGEDSGSGEVTPPAGASAQTCMFNAFDIYLDENDETVTAPIETMYGTFSIDGSDVYLLGTVGAMSDKWVKGTYNAAENTICIPSSQPLGSKDLFGTGKTPLYLLGGDMTTGNICDLLFHFDASTLSFVLDEDQYFLINGKPNSFEIYMMLWKYSITLSSPLSLPAIESTASGQPSQQVFNTAGQRVDANSKGLIISNGKKLMVR
ncbi:MAG: Ig-like domain-containing protein [Bacteroidales bacterium]|nr:Ig-like domain-containing protein [Candidatus Liminaster caballi]